MELDLQSFSGLHVHSCTLWLRTRNSPLPPAFGLIYEGAIGQPRYTTSLCEPLLVAWKFYMDLLFFEASGSSLDPDLDLRL